MRAERWERYGKRLVGAGEGEEARKAYEKAEEGYAALGMAPREGLKEGEEGKGGRKEEGTQGERGWGKVSVVEEGKLLTLLTPPCSPLVVEVYGPVYGTVYGPVYGTVYGPVSYRALAFEDTFQASLSMALEWGAFAYAKGDIRNRIWTPIYGPVSEGARVL